MHRCLEQLYPEITPIICLLRMHFVLSHQCKGITPLPANNTGLQLPSSKIRSAQDRCDAPLLTPCAECSTARAPDPALTTLTLNRAQAAQYRGHQQDEGPRAQPSTPD